MMKSKLIIVISLLFVLASGEMILAEKVNARSSFSPDGVAAPNMQRRRKRRRRGRSRHAEATPVIPPTGEVPTMGPTPPPPQPEAEPNVAPAAAAPPPVGASPDMETPGRGAPSKPKKSSAPKIKPPTVQIKPPTR